MHKWAKEIMEYVKTEVNSVSLKNIEMQHLCELEKWVCIVDKIAEYDYYYHITEAMEENPEQKYGIDYDEHGKYYTQPRRSNGRFMRGYDEMYDMTPMYNDRQMYYTSGSMNGNSGSMGGSMNGNSAAGSMRDYDSRYERARRGYEEAKQMNPDSEDMDKLKEVFDELKSDMKSLKPHMSQNGKTYARNELINMANTMV